MCLRLASFHSRVSVFSSWQSLAAMLLLLVAVASLLLLLLLPPPAAGEAEADPEAARPRWTDSDVISQWPLLLLLLLQVYIHPLLICDDD